MIRCQFCYKLSQKNQKNEERVIMKKILILMISSLMLFGLITAIYADHVHTGTRFSDGYKSYPSHNSDTHNYVQHPIYRCNVCNQLYDGPTEPGVESHHFTKIVWTGQYQHCGDYDILWQRKTCDCGYSTVVQLTQPCNGTCVLPTHFHEPEIGE